jgi:diguanylate cyclase (GGDEF)-like protein/PAS domain S-box-containing protein
MDEFLKSDAVWRRFLCNLGDHAIVILDEVGTVVGWNEGARTMKGYTAEEIVGSHFSVFYTPEARAVGHPERELAVAASIGRYEEEGWRVRKDETRFWAHVVISAIYDDNQVVCGFGKLLRDFTGRKQAAEQSTNIMNLLEYTARTDYLTGLDNRRSLDKVLAASVAAARRNLRPFALAMIDFDKFKSYNDDFGHQAGDIYLKKATAKWRQTLRPEDIIARYGGEEFVVVLPDTARDRDAISLERLRAATPGPLTCSVGFAEWDGCETANALIGRADHALYQAKGAGRDRLVMAPMPEGWQASTPRAARLTVVIRDETDAENETSINAHSEPARMAL